MRLVASTFAGLLLVMAVAAGYFMNVMLTQVTPGNVEPRFTSLCLIGLNAFKLDQRDRIRTLSLGSFSCSCVAEKIIEENGPAAAARTANTFRKTLTVALKLWVTGVRGDKQTLSQAGVSQSDLRQYSRIFDRVGKKCDVAAVK